jgi:hypothetical protein
VCTPLCVMQLKLNSLLETEVGTKLWHPNPPNGKLDVGGWLPGLFFKYL